MKYNFVYIDQKFETLTILNVYFKIQINSELEIRNTYKCNNFKYSRSTGPKLNKKGWNCNEPEFWK